MLGGGGHWGAMLRGVYAVVVTGGDPPRPEIAARLASSPRLTSTLVIAADRGLEHATNLGIDVDLIVGDLDSVDPDALEAARQAGVTVEAHPAEKDATDLALALDAAVARGARHLVVVGGDGGRLDHQLANVALLADDRYAEITIEAWLGPARVVVVRAEAQLDGRPGSLLTLLAVGGPACGVTTRGLRYPLHDENLYPGSSRGVSNELVAAEAVVTVRAGVLLAIQPEHLH